MSQRPSPAAKARPSRPHTAQVQSSQRLAAQQLLKAGATDGGAAAQGQARQLPQLCCTLQAAQALHAVQCQVLQPAAHQGQLRQRLGRSRRAWALQGRGGRWAWAAGAWAPPPPSLLQPPTPASRPPQTEAQQLRWLTSRRREVGCQKRQKLWMQDRRWAAVPGGCWAAGGRLRPAGRGGCWPHMTAHPGRQGA
jgi:hypothetical protein